MIVRSDLPRGVLAAQVVHAAGESSTGNLKSGTYAVALQASEIELHALAARLQIAGVPHTKIIENNDEYAGQLMAIGVRPAPRDQLRRYFSSLPLLK